APAPAWSTPRTSARRRACSRCPRAPPDLLTRLRPLTSAGGLYPGPRGRANAGASIGLVRVRKAAVRGGRRPARAGVRDDRPRRPAGRVLAAVPDAAPVRRDPLARRPRRRGAVGGATSLGGNLQGRADEGRGDRGQTADRDELGSITPPAAPGDPARVAAEREQGEHR